MKRVKSRFTLIEMLAVVAIASILIALITPAVQGLMFGNRVDQCVSNFKLGMEQAQSKAFASRKYVALILPYNHSNSNSSTVQYNQYCKGGYRMAYVTRDGNTYRFERWVDGNDWKNPNAGALCVDITNESPAADLTTWINAVKTRISNLALNGNFSALSHLVNINSTNAPELVDIAGSGTSAALIFSPFGGVVNNDLPIYFTFTETKIDAGRYVFDNIDNVLVLKLNPITGQVTYFDPYAE